MKKTVYIVLLITITQCINAQFAAVLTRNGLILLENDSVVLVPNENLRGTMQWQKSNNAIIWSDANTNIHGDTLTFVPEVSELFRLQIIEGTCLPIYSDIIKIYSRYTTIPSYISDGISIADLLTAGVSVSDMLSAGLSVTELYEGGILVGTLEQSGADSTDLANAGLIGTVTDYDGNMYKWVRIEDQVWMAENLKTSHYADGSAIPYVEGGVEWANLTYTDKAYCWYYDSIANKDIYGGLYTWAAAMNSANSSDANPSGVQGVCPDEWHLPSDAEWKELEMFLGMSQSGADDTNFRGTDEGGKLKETGTSHWCSPNKGATNESGFTALAGGSMSSGGWWYQEHILSYFWVATKYEYSVSSSWFRCQSCIEAGVFRGRSGGSNGHSVRCVKD